MDWGSIFRNGSQAAFGPRAIQAPLTAIGLNIQFGYTGLLNFGQAAFAAAGAYGIAVSVTTYGLSFWTGVAIALFASIMLAIVLGVPTLRLRADYLAIVTIAAAEIVRLIVRSVRYTATLGGTDGLQGFTGRFFEISPLHGDDYKFAFWRYSRDDLWVMIVGWTLVALSCLLVYLLIRSPWGRVLKGIREDEDAVRSLGKNVYSYKMQSLILGGVIGAVAGIIYVLPRAVQPDSMGRPMTFFIWTILLLGGAATVFGPVLGSIIFWAGLMLIKTVMRDGVPETIMRNEQIEQFGWIIVGVTLMLLVIFRPQGILGDKKELAINVR